MDRELWRKQKYDRELLKSKYQAEGPLSYVLILDHLKASFNVGKIIRSAHALGCREVHLVGIEFFDPRPAMGCLRKTRTVSFSAIEESLKSLLSQGYSIFQLHPEGEKVLGVQSLPKKSAFILGHEEYGFSFSKELFPEIQTLKIPQFGKVQSLNVSVAASLASFEYVRQNSL